MPKTTHQNIPAYGCADKDSNDVKIFRNKWSKYPVTVDVRELHNYGGKIDNRVVSKSKIIKRYPCYHLWFSPNLMGRRSFYLLR